MAFAIAAYLYLSEGKTPVSNPLIIVNPCNPSSGWLCHNIEFNNFGNLSFEFGQANNSTIYNVGLTCISNSKVNEFAAVENTLVYLSSNVEPSRSYVASGNRGYLNLSAGQVVQAIGIECFDSGGNLITRNSIAIGFNGSLWASYTIKNGISTSFNGANPIIIKNFANFTITACCKKVV